MMQREENARKELKSIYFANFSSENYNNPNKISLLKLVIHKNPGLT